MSDIELVIKIPEEKYKRVMDGKLEGNGLADYIEDGTPLPKGHGRLIDADKASEVMMNAMCGTGYQSMAMRVVESEFYTPTILEADKESEDKE